MVSITSASILMVVGAVLGQNIYLDATFEDDSWKTRWEFARYNETNFGKLENATVDYGGANNTVSGPKSMESYVTLTTWFVHINIANKPLVLQLQVREFDKRILSCQGEQLRLYACKDKPADKDRPYFLMLGPWTCNLLGLKVNFLGGQRLESNIAKHDCDELWHVCTLILESNMTYQVLIDDEKVPHDRHIQDLDVNKPHNDTGAFPPICGLGFVFDQVPTLIEFDNILLSDDVYVA